MLSENELKRIYDSIDDLDDQYKKLFESIASLKTSVDSLSVDNRSMNTAVQNLSMSFGVLKEKTDAILSSIKSIADSKDDKIDSAIRENTAKFDNWAVLCESRRVYIASQIGMVKDYVDSEMRKIYPTVVDSKESILEIKKKVNYGVYVAITNLVALIAWLVKLLGASYGWWTL